MKKELFLLAFFALFACIYNVRSQDNIKVAMLSPVSKGGDVTEMQRAIIKSALTKALTQAKGYEAFSRSDLDAVVNEQKFQLGGMVSDEQRLKLGELSGANLICISTLTSDGDDFFVEVSLIDVKTGRIVKTADQLMPTRPNAEIMKGCHELADQLIASNSSNSDNTPKTTEPAVVATPKIDSTKTKPVEPKKEVAKQTTEEVEDEMVKEMEKARREMDHKKGDVVIKDEPQPTTDSEEKDLVKEMEKTRREMEEEKARKETAIAREKDIERTENEDEPEEIKAYNPYRATRFGIKAGNNNAYMYNNYDDIYNESGYHLGCFLELRLGKRIALQPEIFISTQNYFYTTTELGNQGLGLSGKPMHNYEEYQTTNYWQKSSTYINFPFMFKFYLFSKIYLEAGPKLGVRISEVNTDPEHKDQYDTGLEVGMSYGVGWEFSKRFFIGVRYFGGLTTEPSIDYNSYSVLKSVNQVYLGFKF